MAKDLIHEAVKRALINDGWDVTHDPFKIELIDDDRALEADLGAEKMLAANKGKDKIVVEIKTFGGSSILYKFHEALGQFIDYRDAIEEAGLDRVLYIAVSINTYAEMMEINFIKRRISKYLLKFVIIDIEDQKVERWIK